ncbi:MAG: HNH endonuclease, partial [Myxococcaceae bacterium]
QVRRLACTAHLIPAVLGADSEILDLGRSQRLFSRAQRKAMAVRDQQCRAQGCTIPATWCEAHHAKQPWTKGGKTDLADGALLCSWHHHRAHDDRYLTDQMSNGDFRFTRRT